MLELKMLCEFLEQSGDAQTFHLSNMDHTTISCLFSASNLLSVSFDLPLYAEQATALKTLLTPFCDYWKTYREKGIIDSQWINATWEPGKSWVDILASRHIRIEQNSLVNLSGVLRRLLSETKGNK